MLHSEGALSISELRLATSVLRVELSWPGCAPRRPRTTQTARTVSLPSLLSRWGVGDGKVIESPGPRLNSSNPTATRSVPLRMYPNSWPLWRPSAWSGPDEPPGGYVASMNSTSSSAQNISRSHVTPELSVMVGRPSARCTASPGPAPAGTTSSDAACGCGCSVEQRLLVEQHLVHGDSEL